ncbi:hypothetical protein BKA81DRAFT_363689 [Phyllosticta paracitricarpa]|uniref:Uncharacterized protein n=1 Tax=Phyllosticta paracitricarpa TaxID=2016321 RepID=A0ABR1MXL4_9PEZI
MAWWVVVFLSPRPGYLLCVPSQQQQQQQQQHLVDVFGTRSVNLLAGCVCWLAMYLPVLCSALLWGEREFLEPRRDGGVGIECRPSLMNRI